MKDERLGKILAGFGIVLRESASDSWAGRFLREVMGEIDSAQARRDVGFVARGLADQCDEKADLVFPLDRPRYNPKKRKLTSGTVNPPGEGKK